MRRYITIFVLLIINFLLQTTVFRYIEIAHMVPNLILVVTVAAGLLYGRKCGIFAGVISGLLTDALYGSVIGIGILIYSVVGYLCGAASKLYFEEDLTVPIVAIAGSDVIYGVLYYACNFMLRGRLNILFYVKSVILPEMIYTVILGAVLFRIIHKLDAKINPPVEVLLKPKNLLRDRKRGSIVRYHKTIFKGVFFSAPAACFSGIHIIVCLVDQSHVSASDCERG